MSILVDSSIWIDYFKGGNGSLELDSLIDENLVVTNDLILTELIPFFKNKETIESYSVITRNKSFTTSHQLG